MNREGLIKVKRPYKKPKGGIGYRDTWVRPEEAKTSNSRRSYGVSKTDKDHDPDVLNEDFRYMDLNTHKNLSYHDVEKIYNSSKSDKSFSRFVKETYFVSTGKNTTIDVYSRDKRAWVERKQKVHDKIVRHIKATCDKPKDGEKPVAYLYGGGSGSGKSTVISKVLSQEIDSSGVSIGKIDCDEIKQQLPEHLMFSQQNLDLTAARLHTESSKLCTRVLDEVIEEGRCFQYDSTMSDLNKFKGIIGRLKAKGYQIKIVGVELPQDIAMERASKRGRPIPDHIFTKTHKGFEQEFLSICELLAFKVDNQGNFLKDNQGNYIKDQNTKDSWELFSNRGTTPELIANTKGIHNSDIFEKFA